MKKRTLTPVEAAECAALKSIWLAKKGTHRISQSDLAEQLGISQSAVSMYLNGVNALSLETALKFCLALDTDLDKVSPRLARLFTSLPTNRAFQLAADLSTAPEENMELLGHLSVWEDGDPLDDDDVEVPYYAEVELAGGDGMTEVIEVAGRNLRFSRETLRAAGVDRKSAAVARVKGNSMERLILDGAAIGFDMSDTSITDGEIYAFNHGGMLRTKYLYRLPHGAIRISSENSAEYPDEILSAETWRDEIRMLGRVFWWSTVRRRRR